MYSFSFAIVPATLMSFFNLSYVSNSFSGAFTDVDEVRNIIAILRVVYFWMELKAESVPSEFSIPWTSHDSLLALIRNRRYLGDLVVVAFRLSECSGFR